MRAMKGTFTLRQNVGSLLYFNLTLNFQNPLRQFTSIEPTEIANRYVQEGMVSKK